MKAFFFCVPSVVVALVCLPASVSVWLVKLSTICTLNQLTNNNTKIASKLDEKNTKAFFSVKRLFSITLVESVMVDVYKDFH